MPTTTKGHYHIQHITRHDWGYEYVTVQIRDEKTNCVLCTAWFGKTDADPIAGSQQKILYHPDNKLWPVSASFHVELESIFGRNGALADTALLRQAVHLLDQITAMVERKNLSYKYDSFLAFVAALNNLGYTHELLVGDPLPSFSHWK